MVISKNDEIMVSVTFGLGHQVDLIHRKENLKKIINGNVEKDYI